MCIRDSFYTGVTEGNIGSARIIKMLDVKDDHLVVESKGIYSIAVSYTHLIHQVFCGRLRLHKRMG